MRYQIKPIFTADESHCYLGTNKCCGTVHNEDLPFTENIVGKQNAFG